MKYMIVALFTGAIIISCKNDNIKKASGVDITNLPSEEVKNFKVLLTAKGVIKNEMTTPLLKNYRLIDTPYYAFPKGIYMASYKDSTLDSDIKADSAIYREQSAELPPFFKAYMNVVVRSLKNNERINTDTLYWDGGIHRIYNHSYTLIYTATDTIPALQGFQSNDNLEAWEWEIRKSQRGSVYFEMKTDSTNINNTLSTPPTQ